MSHKQRISTLLAVAVAVFSATIYFDKYHYDTFGDFLQLPGLLSIISFILLLILYFLPAPVSNPWKKFSLVYIPIAVILTIVTPDSSGGYFDFGGGGIGGGADRESTAWFLSVLFLIVSLILIIRAHSRFTRQAKTPPPVVGG